MAFQLVPVIAAILAFAAKSGTKAAIKKYGKKAVDEAVDIKKKQKSANQKDKNYVATTDKSTKTAPQSVFTRLNNLEKRIESMRELIKQGKGDPKKLDAFKKQEKNLLDMMAEETDLMGGSGSMYGKFNKGGLTKKKKTAGYNKGGMIDYRKTGMFK